MHEILIVDSAAEDLKLLPEASQARTLEWLKKELSASRAKQGTALKGALRGFYVVSQPQRVRVIYWIDHVESRVFIVCVLPGAVSLELKKAELIRKFAAHKPSEMSKTPLERAFEAAARKSR